jgi:hypothetical protein
MLGPQAVLKDISAPAIEWLKVKIFDLAIWNIFFWSVVAVCSNGVA